MQGVTVTLLDGSGNPTGQTDVTDASGNYLFPNLVPGNYIVEFSNLPSGYVFSRKDQGANDNVDSDADPFTGRTGVITLDPGENDLSNDAGVHPCTFTATATAADLTCTTTSVSLVVNTNAISPSYSWTGPNGFTSSAASPTVFVPGTYLLTVTDGANGCTANTSVTVNQNTTLPTVVANNNGPITCAQVTATLDGTGSSTGTNYSYLWTRISGTGNFIGAVNGITATVDGPGVFRLTVTNTVTGCVNSQNTTVTEDVTPPSPVASNDGPFTCLQTSVQVTVTANPGSLAYSWTGPSGFSASTQSANVTVPGTYTVTVTNPFNGCSASASTTVTEDKRVPENVTATGGTITCVNPTVGITASTTTAGVSYSWSGPGGFSQGGQNQTVSVAGNYIVTVRRNDNGCTATATAVVSQNTTPPSASAVGGTLTCNNPTVTLLAFTNVSNDEQLTHHHGAYGFYAPAIRDYGELCAQPKGDRHLRYSFNADHRQDEVGIIIYTTDIVMIPSTRTHSGTHYVARRQEVDATTLSPAIGTVSLSAATPSGRLLMEAVNKGRDRNFRVSLDTATRIETRFAGRKGPVHGVAEALVRGRSHPSCPPSLGSRGGSVSFAPEDNDPGRAAGPDPRSARHRRHRKARRIPPPLSPHGCWQHKLHPHPRGVTPGPPDSHHWRRGFPLPSRPGRCHAPRPTPRAQTRAPVAPPAHQRAGRR